MNAQQPAPFDLDAYQVEMMRRTSWHGTSNERLKLALIGIQEELGEIAGPLKKYLWHGHVVDEAHLQEELGDLLWYVTLLCTELDLRLVEVLQRNVEKLARRYPDGFSQERSQHRQEEGNA